jgi:hypothetical protein
MRPSEQTSKTLGWLLLITFTGVSPAIAGVCDISKPIHDPSNAYIRRMSEVFSVSQSLLTSDSYSDLDLSEKGFHAIILQCWGSDRAKFDQYLWNFCSGAARNRGLALKKLGKLDHACKAWDTAARWGDVKARNWHTIQCDPPPADTYLYANAEDAFRNQFWFCTLITR